MAGRADKVIAVSNNTKNDVENIFGVQEEKIIVINNGVDERFFCEVPDSHTGLGGEVVRWPPTLLD